MSLIPYAIPKATTFLNATATTSAGPGACGQTSTALRGACEQRTIAMVLCYLQGRGDDEGRDKAEKVAAPHDHNGGPAEALRVLDGKGIDCCSGDADESRDDDD